MELAERLKSVLDGGTDPEVCLFREFRTGGVPKHPTAALMRAEDSGVRLAALMRAAHPKNSADADNRQTWLSGDALELFLQETGRPDYHEFHSTPEGIRLQLHLPDHITFRNIPHERKICDAGLRVFNRIDPSRQLWYCEMFVPYAGFMTGAAETFRFGLGRYDCEDDPEKPAISCWPFMKETLHSPEDWREFPLRRNRPDQ